MSRTEESIRAACEAILKERKSSDFFQFHISKHPVASYKNAKRGKPSKNKENKQVAVVTDHFAVELVLNQNQLDIAFDRCGYLFSTFMAQILNDFDPPASIIPGACGSP
ncbi:MAG TPA: hypothetical protein HPP90_04315 [Deltaproteobacteria bacterium]|nr:hypothetical protein [Deltaproteobacteria bacterium]